MRSLWTYSHWILWTLLISGSAISVRADENSAQSCVTDRGFRCLVAPISAELPLPRLNRFGPRPSPVRSKSRATEYHVGVDFPAKTGQPVYGVFPGTIVNVTFHNPTCGNTVIIKTGDDPSDPDPDLIVYCHFSNIKVKFGDHVGFNTVIGLAGATGLAHGTDVHVQFRHHHDWVDPMQYMVSRDDLPKGYR